MVCTKITVVNSNGCTVRSINTAGLISVCTNKSTVLKNHCCISNVYTTTVVTVRLKLTVLNSKNCACVSNSNSIGISRVNGIAIQVKCNCAGSLNANIVIDISKKSDCITAYCCINCSLKSLVLNVADLGNIGYRNDLVCAVNKLKLIALLKSATSRSIIACALFYVKFNAFSIALTLYRGNVNIPNVCIISKVDRTLVCICIGVLCPDVMCSTTGHIKIVGIYGAVKEHTDSIAACAACYRTAGDVDNSVVNCAVVVNCVCNIVLTCIVVDITANNVKCAAVADCADRTSNLFAAVSKLNLTLAYRICNGKSTIVKNEIGVIRNCLIDCARNGLAIKVNCNVSAGSNNDSLVKLNVSKENYSLAISCCQCLCKGLILNVADLCYCRESGNVRINVRVTTVCTCVSCITLCIECRSSNYCLIIVTECINLICNVAFATYTSICCVTTIYTIGSGYNCLIGVAKCCIKLYTAYCTGLCIFAISFCTGSMTLCSNGFLSYESLATNGALLTVLKTGLGTSCILTGNGFLGMTKCRNLICLIAITAYTGMKCVTAVFTVGSNNSRTVNVCTYCVNTVVANGVISFSKLVCIITVIGVICRVKVYECTTGNNELTSVISFTFVDIKNVPIAIVAFSRLKVTALNANDTAGFAEDNVTVRSGVIVTALDSKHRVNTAGDNRICTCGVLTAAYYVTITNDCEMRSIVNVDNLNNTVGFPVSLKCLTVKIKCNDSALNINGFGKVDVSIKNYVEAVCKKVYKITFVCNGKCICCINKHLFGQASANGNVVEIIAVSPVFNLSRVTLCRSNIIGLCCATSTRVIGVTLLSTCRSYNLTLNPSVTGCRNSFIRNNVTARTDYLDVTVFFTLSINCCGCCINVTECRNNFLCNLVVAS